MRLEKTMRYLQEHNEKLEESVRAKNAMLLVKEDEDQKRVIAQEDIERVQSHRQQVVNTLRAFPCFDISDDGKHLECRCCEKNWEKARLNFSENRGKIKFLTLLEDMPNDTLLDRSILHVAERRTHSRYIESTTMKFFLVLRNESPR